MGEHSVTMHAFNADARRPRAWQIWLAAIRPQTLPAAASPVVVGGAVAYSLGLASLLPWLGALLGAWFIQIGTNLANDYFDFKKGADGEERLGPARPTSKGWVTPQQMLMGTLISFALATLTGIYLVWTAGWPILVVGLFSIFFGILYTAGPYALAYTGLGDIFAFLFFGPVAVMGTLYVQSGQLPFEGWVASLPVGLWIAAILVVNNLRDRHTDEQVGKRTWAVRFGERFTRLEYSCLTFGSVLGLAVFVLMKDLSLGWLLPVLLLPLIVRQNISLWRTDGVELNPELGKTARLGLLFSLFLSVGANL